MKGNVLNGLNECICELNCERDVVLRPAINRIQVVIGDR